MSRVLISDGHNPVEWIDSPNPIDTSFIDNPSLIPDKALIAILEPLIKSEVDELFGLVPPEAWAIFPKLKGYTSHLKKLFKQKVLEGFDTELAIETLDNLHEAGIRTDTEDGEALYAMLFELNSLNELLEKIYLKTLSILKS